MFVVFLTAKENTGYSIWVFIRILCIQVWACIPATVSKSGPGCSKLTTSLVNVSLKFQTLISEIRQYFLLKKCEKLLHCKSFSHFSTKNISIFGYLVLKHLTS